jgi:hypothetical protein
MLAAGFLTLMVFAGMHLAGGWAQTPEDKLRSLIKSSYNGSDYASAVNLAEEAIKKKIDVSKLGDEVAESMMALNMYARAARLLCQGTLKARTTGVLDRVGMGVQTGNREWVKDGVCCLKLAVAMKPEDVHLNYDLGMLMWNAGMVEEARVQCELVNKLDPGNPQAAQILERIEKHRYASKASTTKAARRKVTFTIALRKGIDPYIAGSWNDEGRYDQIHGWKRERMLKVGEQGEQVTWQTVKELHTEEGPWYGALISVFPEPHTPAMSLCRFPLYPYETADVTVPMEKYAVEDPLPLLKPREVKPAKAAKDAKPRLFMLCVDSGTWNIWMPLMQAGMMPRLAGIVKRGVLSDLHSDPPVSTIAFDILNFGTGGQFGLKDVLAGGVELLKERGIDLLNYGGIQGKNHTWKVLATQGVSTLYSSWGEQLYYAPGGAETVDKITKDADETGIAGEKPTKPEEKVLPFIPESERKGFSGMKVSDHIVVDHYNLGVRKFYEGLELLRKHKPQVTLVHLGFVDVGYHAFWDAMDSDIAYIRPDRPRNPRYSKVIEGQQRLLDVMLGVLEEELDLEHDSLLIWSDHGATGGFAKTYYGHDPQGVLVMTGPLFKPGVVLAGRADVADLTPTVFTALKLPVPSVYAGKPITEGIR